VSYTFNSAAAGTGDTSTTQGPLGAGGYSFQASFAGDANYNPATSDISAQRRVGKTSRLLTTIDNEDGDTPVTGPVALGTSVHDHASLNGATVRFTADLSQVSYTFNGGAAGSGDTSSTEGPLGAGDYSFQASFAGDANYNPATSD